MKRCLCGCTRPARGKSAYFNDACRSRYHKDRKAREGLTRVEAKRLRDRQAKRAARAAGRIPSDDRVSFARAVEVVAEWMLLSGRVDPGVAEVEAREVMARARGSR